MKIYPGNHKKDPVYFREQAAISDIPLAYVDNHEQDRVIQITVQKDFGGPYHEEAVYPYKNLPGPDTLFFDDKDKPVANSETLIQQKDGGFIMLPQGARTFVPKQFSFTVLTRRADTFKKTVTYPLTFGIKDPDNSAIQTYIVSAVQGQENRREYPANIIINGGTESVEEFQNISDQDCDVIFSPLRNGVDFDRMIDRHICVWLYDTDFDGQMIHQKNPESYALAETMLYAVDGGDLDGYKDTTDGTPYLTLDAGLRWTGLPEGYEEVPFFQAGCPLKIYHKPDAGYLIISHPNFFMGLDKDHRSQLRLFFETVLYVYLHGYCETAKQAAFITDEVIDYYISTAQRYYLRHPRINLEQLLAKNGENTAVQHEIVRCMAEPALISDKSFTVSYAGLNRFRDLLFQKKSRVKDPVKGNNVLVYTMEGTLLFCDPVVAGYKLVESGIRIRQVDEYTVGVSAAKSSAYQICTTEEQLLSLPSVGAYTIGYNRANRRFIVKPEETDVVIATVQVSQNTDIVYRDIRTAGGGEASTVPNYEMIDTGSRYGRPYRYGCPMVIQLPVRFQKADAQIRSELQKHIASGDYPIIIYKD